MAEQAQAPTTSGSTAMVAGTTALGTVSGGQIILWAFDCLAAGHFIKPDQATASLMAGILAPILYGAYKTWSGAWSAIILLLTKRIEQKIQVDLNGDGTITVPKPEVKP